MIGFAKEGTGRRVFLLKTRDANKTQTHKGHKFFGGAEHHSSRKVCPAH